jgi:hypothetical protein
MNCQVLKEIKIFLVFFIEQNITFVSCGIWRVKKEDS